MLSYRKPGDKPQAPVPWQPPETGKAKADGQQKKVRPKTYEEIRELVRSEAKELKK